MRLTDFVRDVFLKEKIEYVSCISLSKCRITRGYLLERAGLPLSGGTAIMLAVPYFVQDAGERNISLYAVSEDYHLYFRSLFERVLPLFREAFPGHRFEGFADHSPIDEPHAAAACGLGVLGKNRMLITEKYSSFVFLGEIICDIQTGSEANEILNCENCEICERSCPVGLDREKCISAISQKKGVLDPMEREQLRLSGSVWGCDICQKVCPHSRNVSESEIEFFHRNRIPFLTSEIIEQMSPDDFRSRAYSWRGRDTVLRNLRIFEDEDNNE